MNGHPFLRTQDEVADFERTYARFPRSVVTRHEKGRPPKPKDIGSACRAQLALVRRTGGGLECVSVSVHERDGMLWSATAVDQAIASADPPVGRGHIFGTTAIADLPEIAGLVGERRFVLTAQRHRLTKTVPVLARRVVVTAAAAAVALTFLGNALSASGKGHADDLGLLLTRLAFILPSILSVVALMIARELATYVFSDRHGEGLAKASADIREMMKDRAAGDAVPRYESFIADLATMIDAPIGWHLPRRGRHGRCFIVAGFDELDLITRDTIAKRLSNPQIQKHNTEMWIVFQEAETSSFSRWLDTDPKARLLKRRTTQLDQQYLDRDVRRKLVAEIPGSPELAAEYLAVGLIRGAPREQFGAVKALLEEHGRQSSSDDGDPTLRLLYLLALSAANGDAEFDRSSVALMAKAEVRAAVLGEFMGRKVSPAQLKQWAFQVEQDFEPLLVRLGDGGTYTIAPEVAEVIDVSRRDLGLPDPALGHLYWAIHWRDHWGANLRQVTGFWGRRVANHLSHAALPVDLPSAVASRVTEPLFNALEWTVEACLQAALPALVRPMLDMATTLVGEDTKQGIDRARRLRSLMWQSFAVLGDGALLRSVLKLTRTAPDRRTIPIVHPLEAAFLPSLVVNEEAETDLERALTEADQIIRDHVRVRGALLVATLVPWIRTHDTPTLNRAREILDQEVVEVMSRALDRLTSADTGLAGDGTGRENISSSCVDLSTTALAGWTVAIRASPATAEARAAVPGSRIGELFDLALVAATELGSATLAGHRFAFVWRALNNDVLAVIGASAGLLAPLTTDQRLAGQLGKCLGDANKALGLGSGPGSPSDALLAASELTWVHLGFSRLADVAAVQRFQARAIGLPSLSAQATFPHAGTSDGGIALEKADAFLALLGGLAVASVSRARRPVAEAIILQAIYQAIDLGIAEPLRTELAWLALTSTEGQHGQRTEQQRAELTKMLVANGASRLESILEPAPDDEVMRLEGGLLQSVDAADEESWTRLRDVLRRRAEHVVDVDMREDCLALIDLLEIRRRVFGDKDVVVHDVFDRWQGRRSHPGYPYVLHLLLHAAPNDRATLAAAEEALSATSEPSLNLFILATQVVNIGASGLQPKESGLGAARCGRDRGIVAPV